MDCEEQLPLPGHNEPHSPIYKRWSGSPSTPRELPGYSQRTTNLPYRVHSHRCGIGSEHDIRVEHCK